MNTALAISLGVLGAVATWLFLGPLGGMLAIWAAFIAWGCYYHSGGKEAGLQSTILGTAAGAVIAGITLAVASASVGASLPDAALLVAAVFCGALAWWTILCAAAVALRTRFTGTGLLWLNRCSGAIIMGFGLAALISLAPLPWKDIGRALGL